MLWAFDFPYQAIWLIWSDAQALGGWGGGGEWNKIKIKKKQLKDTLATQKSVEKQNIALERADNKMLENASVGLWLFE